MFGVLNRVSISCSLSTEGRYRDGFGVMTCVQDRHCAGHAASHSGRTAESPTECVPRCWPACPFGAGRPDTSGCHRHPPRAGLRPVRSAILKTLLNQIDTPALSSERVPAPPNCCQGMHRLHRRQTWGKSIQQYVLSGVLHSPICRLRTPSASGGDWVASSMIFWRWSPSGGPLVSRLSCWTCPCPVPGTHAVSNLPFDRRVGLFRPVLACPQRHNRHACLAGPYRDRGWPEDRLGRCRDSGPGRRLVLGLPWTGIPMEPVRRDAALLARPMERYPAGFSGMRQSGRPGSYAWLGRLTRS